MIYEGAIRGASATTLRYPVLLLLFFFPTRVEKMVTQLRRAILPLCERSRGIYFTLPGKIHGLARDTQKTLTPIHFNFQFL